MSRLTIFLLFVAPLAAASTADRYNQETYLLPVFTREQIVPGAHGSLWMAQLTIHNASDQLAILGPCHVMSEEPPCPPAIFAVRPGATLVDPSIGFFDAGNRGRLSYVNRDIAPQVEMKLRLADISRHTIDAGTEIPVIRSRDFWTTTLRLLNVPVSRDSRVMLRVFDVDDRGEASQVEIRLRTLEGTVLRTHTLSFAPSGYPDPAGLPYAPSIIEIPLETVVTPSQRVIVEIVPLTAGLRFWAYAAITNNVTQHVTLVTPP